MNLEWNARSDELTYTLITMESLLLCLLLSHHLLLLLLWLPAVLIGMDHTNLIVLTVSTSHYSNLIFNQY